MRKTYRRMTQMVLVWTVVLMLSLDTAMACRWLRMRRACAPPSCCQPIDMGCCVPMQKDNCQKGPIQKSDVAVPDIEGDVAVPAPPPVDEPAEPAEPAEPTPPEEPESPKPVDEPEEPAEKPPAKKVVKEEPAPAEPKPTEPKPTEPPAKPEPAKPDTTLDDLFGDLPAEEAAPKEAMPAETPDTGDNLDDLFGPPAEEKPAAKPAEESLDDLFGPPAEKPPAEKPPAEKPPAEKPPAEKPPAEKPPAEKPPAEKPPADKPAADAGNLDDLFGPPAAKKPAAADPFGDSTQWQPLELPMRLWVDNTGSYQVRARLLVVTSDGVRLLKENGRTTTVSVLRLSNADQSYVDRIAVHHGQIGHLAAN